MMVYTGKMDNGQLLISKGQLALVHVAKKELNLKDDDYRGILKVHGGGVESAKNLTPTAFERLMKYFGVLGFKSTAQSERAPDRDPNGQIYPAQLKTIAIQFKQLGYEDTADKSRFCQRVIKKDQPETRSEANKIFEAQKAMLKRNYTKRL